MRTAEKIDEVEGNTKASDTAERERAKVVVRRKERAGVR